MKGDADHSKEQSTADELGDELLRCRMAIVGLHSGAVEREHGATFETLRQHCLGCRDRGPCVMDLKRDPTNQVWEAYCPNSEALYGLVALLEASN